MLADKFIKIIIKHRKGIIAATIIATIICTVLVFFVHINYNIVDYLPEEAGSTKAMKISEEEFEDALPNSRIMVEDVGIQDALAYKEKLEEVPSIDNVSWLDDVMDIKTPIEAADPDLVKQYYKDGNALFEVVIEQGQEQDASTAIYEILGDKGYFSGEAAESSYMQGLSMKETRNAMLIVVPLILIVLIVSTSSWLEPLLFFCAIGVAILINMGTNLILGEVSFVTFSVTPVLQLAVSLDYAVFLLHRFEMYRHNGDSEEIAMARAARKALPTIAASAATTIFGFLALTFMDFGIGSNLGWSLMKGTILSFISVMIFLPGLILSTYKMNDRLKHKNWMPKFKRIPGIVLRIKVPVLILVFLIMIPCYIAQEKNDFHFGSENIAKGSIIEKHSDQIADIFGEDNRLVILVPKGELTKEAALTQKLTDIDYVETVVSYSNTIGNEIPADFLDTDITKSFYSDNFSRIILYTNSGSEGEIAFSMIKEIDKAVTDYYDNYYMMGRSANMYDMREVIMQDNSKVNMIAVVAIMLVILATFRSLSLPVLLTLTIKTSIWINLAIPYFMGTNLNYIGYLIISTVQLGATVDYAILLSHRYMEKRETLFPREAVRAAVSETFGSILVSATVLSIAGIGLALTSSNPMVAEMGILVTRGALLSFVLVVFFLSSLLVPLDKLIQKTTYKTGFINKIKEAS